MCVGVCSPLVRDHFHQISAFDDLTVTPSAQKSAVVVALAPMGLSPLIKPGIFGKVDITRGICGVFPQPGGVLCSKF